MGLLLAAFLSAILLLTAKPAHTDTWGKFGQVNPLQQLGAVPLPEQAIE